LKRGPGQGPVNVAERWTSLGWRKSHGESASVSDRATVASWLRDFGGARKQQILIHRPWGTIAAVVDRRGRVEIVVADGNHSWLATATGSVTKTGISAEQARQVMLEALDAMARPTSVEWKPLV
jgi:hypothetical protein